MNLGGKGKIKITQKHMRVGIGFAHVLNQKIFLYNPIPDIPYYRTEIEAVRPVIIHGDLSKVV